MKDTGGPAFPAQVWDEDSLLQHTEGMTLRDYFAAQVLQGIWSKSGGILPDWAEHEVDIAEAAYEMADVMLKVRSCRG